MQSRASHTGGYAALGLLLVAMAAVFLPQLIKADTLEDVARQQMNLEVVAWALEAYYVDERQIPPWFIAYGSPEDVVVNAAFPGDYLTTPVDYLPDQHDVLEAVLLPGGDLHWYRLQGLPGKSCSQGSRWQRAGCTEDDFVARSNSFLNCSDFEGWVSPEDAYTLWAPGPTQRRLGSGICSSFIPELRDLPYDPSNGTVSNGMIFRFGELPPLVRATLVAR